METQNLHLRRTILVIVAIAILVSAGLWVRYQLAIDGCLDSGGRWDYDAGKCDSPLSGITYGTMPLVPDAMGT
jgi:hypothetical protein